MKMKSLKESPIPTRAFTTGTGGNGSFSKDDKFSLRFTTEGEYSRDCPCSSGISPDTLGDTPRLIETSLWRTFLVSLGGEIRSLAQTRIRLSDRSEEHTSELQS